MAADYTSERQQFGRPLSTFQGVALKAADAHIDTEAMRVTLWQAAWRLTAGIDATRGHGGEVVGAEGGQRAVHIAAPPRWDGRRRRLSRTATSCGASRSRTRWAASAQLARLGRALAEAPA